MFLGSLAGGRAQARADDDDQPPLNSVSALFGAGTPLGGAGLEYVRRAGPFTELTGGLGVGANANEKEAKRLGVGSPLQWAVMPRLRLGSSRHSFRHSFTLGVGLSGGNYADVNRHYFGAPYSYYVLPYYGFALGYAF